MSRLDAEQIQERNRLDALVKQRRLYCEKHQRVIIPKEFWTKRCYLSRTGDACEHALLLDELGGGRIK